MICADFQAGRCHSCPSIAVAYPEQLAQKQQSCQNMLGAVCADMMWLPPCPSPEQGFRNKAKMVVSGHWSDPVLGIQSSDGRAIDLTACPLYPEPFYPLFDQIKTWIRLCCLMPYCVTQRTGELKFVLISYSQSTQAWMIRWVLASTNPVARMRQHLPELLAMLPPTCVVSVNIQPVAMAILEGETEILLTEQHAICYLFNHIPLYCRPKSFFQTNDLVAAALYLQVQAWVLTLNPQKMWDLFCGVGGFALHCAQVLSQTQITGIEVSQQAIHAAQLSAAQLGYDEHRVLFRALRVQDFSAQAEDHPELIIVNPPRRGLGSELCAVLNDMVGVRWLIYSSCHPVTLAQDMVNLSAFVPVKARLFDMFPHTDHAEVVILLSRV